MSKLDYDGYKKNNEFNTWISHLYCSIREGMREIIQNQKDAIIDQIESDNFEINIFLIMNLILYIKKLKRYMGY